MTHPSVDSLRAFLAGPCMTADGDVVAFPVADAKQLLDYVATLERTLRYATALIPGHPSMDALVAEGERLGLYEPSYGDGK